MIKLWLSKPVPPEDQAAVDAWLDAVAQAIEAEHLPESARIRAACRGEHARTTELHPTGPAACPLPNARS